MSILSRVRSNIASLAKLRRSQRLSRGTIELHLDSPSVGAPLKMPTATLRGWAACHSRSAITGISFVCADGAIETALVERPDVRTSLPNAYSIGFVLRIDYRRLSDVKKWSFSVTSRAGDVSSTAIVEIGEEQVGSIVDRDAIDAFLAVKQRKIARILEHVVCPSCRDSNAMVVRSDEATCTVCDSTFGGRSHLNFLTEELRALASVEATDNVSSNDYDPIAIGLIDEFATGLILDNGSGFRGTYYGNVINLEIVDYDTTDVMGVGERLPFKDEVFDAVFSLAVLEHVKDPFRAASEITRVLKPGGKVYAAVPFLQPFHGYPNHYYNMTSNGLRQLFTSLDVIHVNVPASGLPIWALTWILQSWCRGLPEDAARNFKQLRVKDLLGDPISYLDRDFVTALAPKVNDELACMNTLLASKKQTLERS